MRKGLVAEALLIAALCAVPICLFFPEAGAMFWHIRHGASASFGKFQFPVPAFYSSQSYPDKNVLFITSVPGRARSYLRHNGTYKVSLISIYRAPADGQVRALDQRDDPYADNIYNKSVARQVFLAGDPGRCVEYQGPAMWNGQNDFQVFCQFSGGIEAHFEGTATGLGDFYKILGTALKKEST